MTARVVRRVVIGVCVIGIAGMIAGSVADNSAVALTFGLVTAAAVACLIVATAVSPPTTATFDEDGAARVEDQVGRLVAAGADEAAVRALVREAVRLGRGRQRAEIPQIPAPNADD
jgi:hypothetical protein